MEDANKLKGEMVYVGSGKIAYSAWMFATVFGTGGRGAYSIAERPVLLTRVGEGLESCLCSYMGLTLYPVKTEQAERMKRLAYREPREKRGEDDDEPSEQTAEEAAEVYEEEDDADVCTIGVLETGEEVWSYREVFFFPIVPTLDRWWPCVPSPALFAAIAKIVNARLIARRRENGEPAETMPLVCPMFYSTRVEARSRSHERFIAMREFLGPLHDPLFDTTMEEDAGLLGVGALGNVNNFQAGIGVTFLSCDKRSHEKKRHAAIEVRNLIGDILDEELGDGVCYVLVERGPVRRRIRFSATAGFKYTSVFEPVGFDKLKKCHSVRLLNSALKPLS